MKLLIASLVLAGALATDLVIDSTPTTEDSLTFGLVAATNSAAQLKGGCRGAVCGTVSNRTNLTIKVTKSWCDSNDGPCSDKDVKELSPNKSTHGSGDVDGFYVPPGYKFKVEYDRALSDKTKWIGTGWHKITTDTVARIKDYTH